MNCSASFPRLYAALFIILSALCATSPATNTLAGPKMWGENVPGVKTRLDTSEKLMALTFDACGSKNDGFDSKLIGFLEVEKIPATLFISGKWIDRHPKEFERIAGNPLFEIGNHGLEHKPCSVNGRKAYGIMGTGSPREVMNEVERNAEKIKQLTGKKPVYYRSGTAHYDEIAAGIVTGLGYTIAGFSVLGDAGATYSSKKVAEVLEAAPAGSIVIMHMNHPGSGTADGVRKAVPVLKNSGFKFVRLSDCALK